MWNTLYATAIFSTALAAAPIDVINQHYLTLGTGETLRAIYSTENWTRNFGGLPTGAGFYGSGTPTPEGPTSLRVVIESIDGLVSWSTDTVASPNYFRFGPEGAPTWEGPGFSASAPMWTAPLGLFGPSVVVKVTNNGIPLTFGDPVNWVFEDGRIGLSLWSPRGSVGAGIATFAEIVEDAAIVESAAVVENPEPATWLITGSGMLLWAALRRNLLVRNKPSLS